MFKRWKPAGWGMPLLLLTIGCNGAAVSPPPNENTQPADPPAAACEAPEAASSAPVQPESSAKSVESATTAKAKTDKSARKQGSPERKAEPTSPQKPQAATESSQNADSSQAAEKQQQPAPGGSKTVTVVVAGKPGPALRSRLIAKLLAHGDEPRYGLAVPKHTEERTAIEISPVNNVADFAEAIRLAEVIDVDVRSRTIRLKMPQ